MLSRDRVVGLGSEILQDADSIGLHDCVLYKDHVFHHRSVWRSSGSESGQCSEKDKMCFFEKLQCQESRTRDRVKLARLNGMLSVMVTEYYQLGTETFWASSHGTQYIPGHVRDGTGNNSFNAFNMHKMSRSI